MYILFQCIYILSLSANNIQVMIVLALWNNDKQLQIYCRKKRGIGKPIVIRNCWSPMIMFMIYRLKIYPCFWHKVIYLKPVILVKWPHSKELMLSIYLLSLGANLSTRYSLWWTHSSGEDEGRLLFVVWSSFPIINLTRLLMQ